eukprot:GILJ01002175.1.p1 GENE.GILJ01002175.1~~GILJ01002175.1.p1  ORF type:complete len:594 (+),score=122.23 GILJ01002175.1:50-1783(+)
MTRTSNGTEVLEHSGTSLRMRKKDTIEPTVLDVELLRESLFDVQDEKKPLSLTTIPGSHKPSSPFKDAKRKHAGVKAVSTTSSAITFANASGLRLSFRNILNIENLTGLTSLVKLQLDNNIIHEIRGLDTLVNLTWLDLSYNNIRKISGLDNLTKLADLSLKNNQITIIEGMDNLVNLNVLSIGNNQIREYQKGIAYLRRFKHLRAVSLAGNPFCSDIDWQAHVLAYLRNLMFLDWVRIKDSDVTAAREQYQVELREIEEKERIEDSQQDAQQLESGEYQRLLKAHLKGVHMLWDDLVKEDTDLNKLRSLPGGEVKILIDDYHDKFYSIVEHMKGDVFLKLDAKQRERSKMENKKSEYLHATEAKSIEMIQSFEAGKKKTFRHLEKNRSSLREADLHGSIQPLKEDINRLHDELLSMELSQSEHFSSLNDEFEVAWGDIKNSVLDVIYNEFRMLEELENNFSEAVKKVATDALDRFTNEAVTADAEELTDDALALLHDRDQLFQAVSNSHENHIGKILSAEDAMREQEQQEFTLLVQDLQNKEFERNRERVLEVHRFTERTKQDLHGAETVFRSPAY